jgi:curved DNA-binding protein CbpA
MDPMIKTRVEIETLHELLDEIDYYKILLLERDAAQAEVDPAFRQVTRRLHPDRLARLNDEALKEKANDIFRLANEAFRHLKDPDTRARYDMGLADGNLRMSADGRSKARKEADAKNNPELEAKTPQGEKYFKMALKCWGDGDFRGAVMQLRFAIQFEPGNEIFTEWLQKAEEAQENASAKKDLNPYKLRIV